MISHLSFVHVLITIHIGLPEDTLKYSGLREQLMAAERKIEEAEMDDCYLSNNGHRQQPPLFLLCFVLVF